MYQFAGAGNFPANRHDGVIILTSGTVSYSVVIIKIKREYFILNLKIMQEASKRRCNKIKLLSLSFVSKLI